MIALEQRVGNSFYQGEVPDGSIIYAQSDFDSYYRNPVKTNNIGIYSLSLESPNKGRLRLEKVTIEDPFTLLVEDDEIDVRSLKEGGDLAYAVLHVMYIPTKFMYLPEEGRRVPTFFEPVRL